MASLSRRRRSADFWPGFVDALAALLMVMVFVILIFVVGQFVLSDAISGRDQALARLNKEIAALAHTLNLSRDAQLAAENKVSELSASLQDSQQSNAHLQLSLDETHSQLQATQSALTAHNEAAARLVTDIAALQRLKAELEQEIARQSLALQDSTTALQAQAEVSAEALAQIELLNRQLSAIRTQLDVLNAALGEAKTDMAAKDLQLQELGRELNLALAARVQELNHYRSEFFGRLREVLGQRDDIQVVGDRFVFSSEVLFASASDEVSPEGLKQLGQIADTLKTLAREMPADLPWVLQVDGHTDRRPISTPRFPSNWELSSARALAIVKFLRDQGVPADRLAATGYGEYHPLQTGNSAAAHARNRRIELKLTNR